jgi:uncharacterized membrane protein YdjX (TVP38/TMEM64 family)
LTALLVASTSTTTAFVASGGKRLAPRSSFILAPTTTTQLSLRSPPGVGRKNKKKGQVVVETKSSSSGIFDGIFDNHNKEQHEKGEKEMADLTSFMRQDSHHQSGDGELDFKTVAGVGGLLLAGALAVFGSNSGMDVNDAIAGVQHFFADPTASLEAVVSTVESMGPTGALYFGLVYTVAEILAIPAFPLTASAGYLFGTVQGTTVVLTSASIAAAVSFVIGRTILRSYVETLLEEYPDFQKIDKAIGREGFKLMLLLRLSPVFPFALSNYLYGASSVRFWPYFWGTMIGFTPGTIAYVYSGEVGKALTLGDGSAQPWYIYLGGFALLSGFLKVLADVATGIIDEIDDEA